MTREKPPQVLKESFVWPPEELENWIFFATKRFCQTHTISPYDREDLVQFVALRFVERSKQIQANYKGSAKLKTYIYAVILNFCREFQRKNNSKSVFTNREDYSTEMSNSISNEPPILKDMSIDFEIQRFSRILLLQGSKTAKAVVSLKAYFDLPLEWKDIFEYTSDEGLTAKHLGLFKEIKDQKKNTIILFLMRLFNECEKKTNGQDAVRKWVERTIQTVLGLLNSGGARTHSKETLGILMEIKFGNIKTR